MLKAITLQNNTKTSRKLKFLSVNALKTYGFCKKRRRLKKLKSLASKSVKKLTSNYVGIPNIMVGAIIFVFVF